MIILNFVLHGRLAEWLFFGAEWLLSKEWYWTVLGGIFAVIYIGVAGLWMIGEFVHVGLTKSLRCSVMLLEFIDRHTLDGTIGLVGFSLLFIGFSLQIVAAYSGGRG